MVCRPADKNKILIKNKTDDSKDKLLWKWSKGADTLQSEFGDPTVAAEYALCYLHRPLERPAQAAQRAAEQLEVVDGRDQGLQVSRHRRRRRRHHQDHRQGRYAGTQQGDREGEGRELPDFDSDLPIPLGDLPMVVQLRNNETGICWEGQFTLPKKNVADQFNAKSP